MNNQVCLIYHKGILNEKAFKNKKESMLLNNIEVHELDISNRITNSLEEFSSEFILLLKSEFVQGILLGVATSAVYDSVKGFIIWVWNSLKGKFIYKASGINNVKKKKVSFGIKFSLYKENSIEFQLSGDVNDEIKGQIIDKAFEIIKENKEIKDARNDLLMKYNHIKNEWEVIDIIKEIRKKVDMNQ